MRGRQVLGGGASQAKCPDKTILVSTGTAAQLLFAPLEPKPPTARHSSPTPTGPSPAASSRQSAQAAPWDSSPAATGRKGLFTASISTS